MRLILYPTSHIQPIVRPAPSTRTWMDQSPQAFAYRCLPLNIANAHGWELLCPSSFEARWNGGSAPGDVEVRPLDDGGWPGLAHFGSGVITFHAGYLFRTDPEYDLWVGGPINSPKDGIIALTGVVETDWAPYTFTMNWLFTRPGVWIRFQRGEPFCHFFPVQRGKLEATTPEIRSLDSDPETRDAYTAWMASRGQFLQQLPIQGSDAQKQKWQKDYYRGLNPDGQRTTSPHRTKLQLAEVADRRKE